MGRFWFTCPITGETQVVSNEPSNSRAQGYYSARLTAEEIEKWEREQRAQADLFKREWSPPCKRHSHQDPPNAT